MSRETKWVLELVGTGEYLRVDGYEDDAYTDDLAWALFYDTPQLAQADARPGEVVVPIEFDEDGCPMEVQS